MKNRIKDGIFSFSGASITIGVVGFLSGIVTIFVDVDSQLTVKWLLFTILVFVSFTLILLKIIYDYHIDSSVPQSFEVPIKYVADEHVFIIHRNINFTNTIVVGCYVNIDEIDRLAYLGVVHLIQEKVIQVKIRADYQVLEKIPDKIDELKKISIRPVVPVTALEQFNDMEN